MAIGEYLPEGTLPREAELEQDGGHRNVHRVVVSPEVVLSDHHALYLDLQTTEPISMPRIGKYNLDIVQMNSGNS